MYNNKLYAFTIKIDFKNKSLDLRTASKEKVHRDHAQTYTLNFFFNQHDVHWKFF